MRKKMHRIKKLLSVSLGMLLVLTAILSTGIISMAADPTIDTSQKGSLSIYKYLGDDTTTQITDDSVGYTIYLIGYLIQETDASGNVTASYNDKADGSGNTIDVSTLDPKNTNTTGLTPIGENTYDLTEGCIYFDNLELGLYLVVETKRPSNVVAANNFFVQIPMSTSTGWVYDVEASPKNTEYDGTITKTVDGGADTSVNLGGTVSYKVDVTLPTDISNYTVFSIVDTVSQYITLSSFTIVSDLGTAYATPADYDITTVGNVTTIAFTAAGIAKMADGEVITITYTGTVDPGAPINTAMENTVKVIHDTGDGPGEEPGPEPPKVFVYSYALLKVGSDNPSTGLPGAEFIMQNTSSEYIVTDGSGGWTTTTVQAQASTFTSGPDGIVVFSGFKEGIYTITETKAPNGYTLLAAPFQIEINAASSTTQIGGQYTITVVDQKDGTQLPGTGGMGVYIFYAVGGILMIVAVALFIRAKKKGSAK